MTIDDLLPLAKMANRIRRRVLDGLMASGGGHYGGALSVVDILVSIYSHASLGKSPTVARDKIILSKGHAAIALYALLEDAGELPPGSVQRYGAFDGGVEGHPDVTVTPQVGFSTGSLGQGLSVAAGIALACGATGRRVWTILGDGECQEGQVWEAALFASRYRLGNLIVVVDHNAAQECGFAFWPELEQIPIPGMEAIWRAFGWNVVSVDGHNLADLDSAFESSALSEVPTAVIAHTCKGKGVPFFVEEPERYHCVTLSDAEHALAVRGLEE